jgi:hypothetical protein
LGIVILSSSLVILSSSLVILSEAKDLSIYRIKKMLGFFVGRHGDLLRMTRRMKPEI